MPEDKKIKKEKHTGVKTPKPVSKLELKKKTEELRSKNK